MKSILAIACLVCLSFTVDASAQCSGGSCSLAARPVRAVAQARPLRRVAALRPGRRVVQGIRRPLARLLGR